MCTGSPYFPNQCSQSHIHQSVIDSIQASRTRFLNLERKQYISYAHLSQPRQHKLQAAVNALNERARHLKRLIPIGPRELADRSIAGQDYIVRRLLRSLRGERTRGKAGHWSYDLNRHIGLVRALRTERATLRRMRAAQDRQNKNRPN